MARAGAPYKVPRFMSRTSRIPLFAALFLQACATTVAATAPAPRLGPATDADRAAAERLRLETPKRIAAQAEALWSLWTTGDAEPVPCQGEACGGPTESDVLSLRRVREASRDEDERRALGLLEAHLVGELVAKETAGLRDREEAVRAAPSLEVGGARHAFRELGALLAREADRERRHRIAAAAAPVLRELDEIAVAMGQKIDGLSLRLGYDDAAELEAIFLPLPAERLEALAESFLSSTDAEYRRALAEAARRELGLSGRELRRADLPRLFGGILFDVRFPREGGRAALDRTFASLGLEAPAALRIDDAARPDRVERPACFPLRPPADVRLALPSAPTADWRPSFQAAACAWQAASVAEDRFEFTLLGSPGVARGLAQAVGDLPVSPGWLRTHTLLTEAEIRAQTAGEALQRLFVARRAAGRILAAKGDHSESMSRALGVKSDSTEGSRWLSSRDGGDPPRDFVALLAGAMVRERLEALHGDSWWESDQAGRTLAALWGQGGRLDPDGLARMLGAKELESAPLARQLVARIAPLLRAPPRPKAQPRPEPPTEEPAPEAEPEEEGPPPALSAFDQGTRSTSPFR